MSAPKSQSLKERYEKIVGVYIDQFCKKHDVEFESWIGDRVGEIACIMYYTLQFEDIRYDIDNEVPKGKIWAWQGHLMETGEYSVNFRNYLKMEL